MPNPPQQHEPSPHSEIILSLQDVHRGFGDIKVMKGLGLDVQRGETVVVMGESGSGKSVLIKLMNALLLPDQGHVELFGRDTRAISRDELMSLRARVGTLFQTYALFDSMSVTENVAFPLIELKGMGRGEAATKARELLNTLGLDDAGDLFPAELSGGMKKRVSLARALITDPELVLFDEPTTGLDPVMIEFVDNMLIDARERFHLTSVIISHDMASAFKLADRLAMLHDGRITFVGTPDAARHCDRPEVQRFISAATSRLEDEALDEPDVGNEAQDSGLSDSVESANGAQVHTHLIAGTRPAEQNDEGEEFYPALRYQDLPVPEKPPLVTIEDLHKDFSGRKVLKGCAFYILPEKITTIIGGSGSGKTVLMKHVLGLFSPSAGRVTVFGKDLAQIDKRELIAIRQRFGMLFQSAALFDSMSVVENVMFPLMERPGDRLGPRKARAHALDTLQRLKIGELADKAVSEISNGQRKRVGLARAIVTNPEILIYDEPTTGLDPVMTAYVNDMIVEAQAEFNITALIVSHDMASTFRISHRIAMLYRGEIVAFGPPAQIIRSPHPNVQEFIFAGNAAEESESRGSHA